MSSCDCRKWQVTASINGPCVYTKDKLTQKEANDFVAACATRGIITYEWPDGDMFVGCLDNCAYWSKKMPEYAGVKCSCKRGIEHAH